MNLTPRRQVTTPSAPLRSESAGMLVNHYPAEWDVRPAGSLLFLQSSPPYLGQAVKGADQPTTIDHTGDFVSA